MATINVTDSQGSTKVIDVKPELSLMEVLRDEGYDEIQAICGGCCSCATCHVHILEAGDAGLPIMEENEQVILELADGFDETLSRLSCQIELDEQHDGLKVLLLDED